MENVDQFIVLIQAIGYATLIYLLLGIYVLQGNESFRFVRIVKYFTYRTLTLHKRFL